MKRLFPLLLVLLVLAGCGKQENTPPQTTQQQETQPDPGWYIPDSDIERTTNGAIRMYDLPSGDVLWIRNIGSNLLLATETGFTVLSGENCTVSATATPEIEVTGDSGDIQFTSQGLAYYLAKSNEAVYLDNQLEEISRITLPEKPDSTPVIAPDGSEIFYCIGNEIRAYDTTRNITRPVKKQLVKEQRLTGALFGGKVLCCNVVYDSGAQGVIYLDSQTGETRSTDGQTVITDTDYDTYFAVSNDGVLRQEIFGTRTAEPSALDIPDNTELISAVGLNGVTAVSMDGEEPTKLSFYDLRTGSITSTVKLSGVGKIRSACADKWSRCIWLLVEDNGEVGLLRWTPDKSKVDDATSYKIPVYTADDPDTAGLEACEERVREINKTYNVNVRIWKDAVEETGDHTATVEHRPAAIQGFLDELESVLQSFPDKFLRKSATRPLQLCIVRNVNGGSQSVQFYKNKNAYIFLSTAGDVRTEFVRGLGYVVNSRVVSNTSLLDTWTDLNPEGFTYGQGKAEYLTGENRAFADESAMISVVEDRCSIFRYAMEEGNAELFTSKTMQKKLELLCRGIRKVWKLQKEEVSYPWEQYLKESLAYKK